MHAQCVLPLGSHRLPILSRVAEHRNELPVAEAKVMPRHPRMARAKLEVRVQIPVQHLNHMAPAHALVPCQRVRGPEGHTSEGQSITGLGGWVGYSE